MSNKKEIEKWFALLEAHLAEAKGHWVAANYVKKIEAANQPISDCYEKLDSVKQSADMLRSYIGKQLKA